MLSESSVRTPVDSDSKRAFKHACKACNGKLMAPVIRDLMSGFVKAVRKAVVFPGNYEAPNYQEVLGVAVEKERAESWMSKRP